MLYLYTNEYVIYVTPITTLVDYYTYLLHLTLAQW